MSPFHFCFDTFVLKNYVPFQRFPEHVATFSIETIIIIFRPTFVGIFFFRRVLSTLEVMSPFFYSPCMCIYTCTYLFTYVYAYGIFVQSRFTRGCLIVAIALFAYS